MITVVYTSRDMCIFKYDEDVWVLHDILGGRKEITEEDVSRYIMIEELKK